VIRLSLNEANVAPDYDKNGKKSERKKKKKNLDIEDPEEPKPRKKKKMNRGESQIFNDVKIYKT